MKNAALPIIFACVLVRDKCCIENIPNVSDVTSAFNIIRSMGAKITTVNKNTVEIDCTDVRFCEAPYELVSQMRAPIIFWVRNSDDIPVQKLRSPADVISVKDRWITHKRF